MDSMSAFAMGEANRGKDAMVFDWDAAARMLVETKATRAEAGLRGDWEWTGGEIWADGAPVRDAYTYLSSTWATPLLLLTMPDGSEESRPCFRMDHEVPDWNESTKWPASACDIVGAPR